MRKLGLLILLGILSNSAKAQFLLPGGFPSFNDVDTPGIQVQRIEPVTDKGDDDKVELPKVVEDTFITKTKAEIARLQIEAEKLRIERELAELKNKNAEIELTPEEKELIRLKTQNLSLLNTKEQLIIKQELEEIEKKKNLRVFPPSVIYGHDIFRSDNFELYETTSEIVATEGYVLGTGDVVQIEMWGYKYWSKSYIIEENGNINIQGFTNIFVKGLTLKQARGLIASRLGVSGNSSSMSITVTRPRMVSVTILGEVFNPGTYTLPATNSAFNFLVAMGGPTNIGSVRNIYIKRDGLIRDSFDLYEYFNKTLHVRDVYLHNGDYIIVGPLANTTTIAGAVRKPGIYEIKNSDNLSQAIAMAGGTLKNAYLKDVVITRFQNSKYEVISVNYDSLISSGKDFNLRGVDQISFKGINADFKIAVSVTGGVSVPGSYKLKSKMRVSGIIKNANGLSSDAYAEKGYLVRTELNTGKKEFITFSPKSVLENPGSEEDIYVLNNDSLYIFRTWEITDKSSIQITGSVYKPFISNYISNINLGQFIFMAGGFTPDYDATRGYILRTRDEYYKEVISFNPSLVKSDSNIFNIEIMPKDVVRIFSRADQFKNFNIRISGAIINKDTTLKYAEKLTVYDVIRMSGGLEEWAYTEKAIVTRTDYANNKKVTFIVNLDEILNDPSSKENLLLERSDNVLILDTRSMMDRYNVSIEGSVRSPRSFEYSENLRLSSLILKAGGLKTTAFRNRAIIVSQDLVTGIKTSKTVDLNEVLRNPVSSENVEIKPGDKVRVFDLEELTNDFDVFISGPVKRAGTFPYSDNMTLQNLIDLAGGLEFITAGSRMEIVRNFYSENGEFKFLEPKVLLLPISSSLTVDTAFANFVLQPFDRIFVRTNPDYVPLKTIRIEGAVRYPGTFALQGDNERINSVLRRAGGFKLLAFPEGSQLKRVMDGDTINIVLNSRKALNRRRSHYNYVLRDGDLISIPYSESIVMLSGDLNTQDQTNLGVYYRPHKRAKYYIKKFGGGFTKTSDKRRVVVEHKNGARVGTRNYVIFKVYPKIRKGSKIIVTPKIPKADRQGGRSKFDTEDFLNKLITRATAVLTIMVLYRVAVGN